MRGLTPAYVILPECAGPLAQYTDSTDCEQLQVLVRIFGLGVVPGLGYEAHDGKALVLVNRGDDRLVLASVSLDFFAWTRADYNQRRA